MSQLIITRSSPFHRAIRNRQFFLAPVRVGKFFLLFTLTFLLGLMSFFYLVKFTEIHTKGYQLRKLELEKNKLLTTRESKSTDIALLMSLRTIRESAVTSSMVRARAPIFIKGEKNIARLK